MALVLSCSAACGFCLDQGSNPCPLNWQVDSLPLSHQESPAEVFLCRVFGCGVKSWVIGPRSRDLKPTLVSASKAFALPAILLVFEHQSSQACLEVNTPGPIQAYWLRTQQGGWLPGPFWFSLKVWGPSVQFSRSVMSESCNPWTAACLASLSITSSWSLLKLSVMPSNHLILCHPLLLPPSVFPSISVFSTESVLHMMWPKYWSFSISPSNEYSGLISFRIDWLDLLAVQGTFKSLLQHLSS